MIDLATRSTDPEALDLGVAPDEALRSLADIRLVNRWLANRGRFVASVAPFLRSSPRPRLLDVGCGSGDLPLVLRRVVGGHLTAVGLDIKLLHLQAAPRDLLRVVADARRLPFGPRAFDVVTASLFLHHFDEPELPDLLRSLYALCRRALVVNDLRRARVPYVFGTVAFPLLFRSPVSVQDGLVSIRRSFREPELRAAFAQAGIPGVRVERHWPYRLLAVAERPHA
ncbi:MAG TPA: methyltransferase domain-containing protein [Vicinamibacteria bacterium]|nr:methyltransferase domain-containing protein [Vicinamibacteria bacterium]